MRQRQGGWLPSYQLVPAISSWGELTEDTSRTAERIKTGSSAASNRWYVASHPMIGKVSNGTTIILDMIATKTVLFSPGYALLGALVLVVRFRNLRSIYPPRELSDSFEGVSGLSSISATGPVAG